MSRFASSAEPRSQLTSYRGERLGKEKLARVVAWRGGLVRDVDHGCDGNGDVNWWRDPRELRRQGYENGKLPTGPGGFHPSQ